MSRWMLLFCLNALLLVAVKGTAQHIRGVVLDEQNDPVPFANIFIRELETGTSSDQQGKYYLTINPGVYHLAVSCVGYHSYSQQIVVSDQPLILNIRLKSSSVELNEITVKASKRDPAFEIIQQVIRHKDRFLAQLQSFKTSVYLRAVENIEDKKKVPVQQDEDDGLQKSGPPVTPLAQEKKNAEAALEKINLVEMQLTLNYQYPNRYKEERTAFKSYGTKEGLFIPVFSETDFNIYHNLVNLKGISEIPLISPVSKTAILSYKYKLEEVLKEDGVVVYKIRVIPRKTGDATCKGYLYINDSTWNINRLELTLQKGALRFYDAFTIKQHYKQIDSTTWMPFRQMFEYETKAGPKHFRGSTVLVYSDFQKDFLFPQNFFGNEVSVTTKEAYTRDSAYWRSTRAEPLTTEQQKMVWYRDSVAAAHSTKQYLDSIEARYNRITLGEVLYHGLSFRRESKKSSTYFSSLLSLVNFEVVGGFRLGPMMNYFRRFENGRMFSVWASFTLGLKNMDWQGSTHWWMRYDPYHLGDVSFRVGRSFHSINSFDAYLNQLRISNYILHEYVHGFHRRELFNGFYIGTDLAFHDRKSIINLDRTSVLNRIIEEDDPILFDDYQALISELRFSYTPKQRFMSEPNQKVVLGSRYPTFHILHRKGWNNFVSSDVNFDFLQFSIDQNLLLGTLGNSRYNIMAGSFLNNRNLPYVDLKRFRQSDPYLYSDPLNSFQLLDTALSTTRWFFEAHYIHHFNGAMINNLPFIKKTKIRTVAGAGFMWIKDSGYRHEELFGGIERIFKLGARRRLRIGLYGVVAHSNNLPPVTGYKISFDVIDTWKRDWSY